MSTFAIGDIHGNLEALSDVLDQLRPEAGRGDTIVFLGDYIDRGSDSNGCIGAILDFKGTVEAEVVCLRGNHEDWLLETMHDHHKHSWLLAMEGLETVRSYSAQAADTLRTAVWEDRRGLYGKAPRRLPYEMFFDSIPADHLHFFVGLRLYHQTADCICSHGGLDARVADLHLQTRNALMWGAGGFPESYTGTDLVVYGHWDNATVDEKGWPLPTTQGRTIGIDTISHGVLTAIRLPEQHIYQSGRDRR
jgi:serine/threonine protein phosphatase 1